MLWLDFLLVKWLWALHIGLKQEDSMLLYHIWSEKFHSPLKIFLFLCPIYSRCPPKVCWINIWFNTKELPETLWTKTWTPRSPCTMISPRPDHAIQGLSAWDTSILYSHLLAGWGSLQTSGQSGTVWQEMTMKNMDCPTLICFLRTTWQPCLRCLIYHKNSTTPADVGCERQVDGCFLLFLGRPFYDSDS